MVNGKTIIGAVIIALVAGLAAWFWWSGDERAIRKQLARIEAVGSKTETEPPVEGLVKATQLAALFSDPCRFTVQEGRHEGSYGRKRTQEHILMIRSWFAQVAVTLHDIIIERIENKTAAVRGTIRLQGKDTGGALAEAQEFTAEMAKIEGKWLFTSVTFIEVLER
ncbi:MAG: nuclear transport factor 2 family protein [Proteobacteria bacterium]|nr:nuclear transport factor 2 family protein [Pseudomonadota bacterium]